MAKAKRVRKNLNWCLSEAKGSETGPHSARSPQKGPFCHVLFFYFFHFLTQKRLRLKTFLEEILISLTLKTRTVFVNF